jgi:lipopolysaccharide/colanic/teichoic acid biosynthesis glycosyltransferase
MEPDILATPGQHASRPATWPAPPQPVTARAASSVLSVAAHGDAVNGVSHGAQVHAIATPLHHHGHATAPPEWTIHALPIPAGAARVELRTADSLYLRWGKRVLDVAGALFALVLTAPLMAVMAALIKLESRGPVLYKSQRIGRGGKPFTFYKLRSMVDGAHQRRGDLAHLNECDGPVFKISRDPRVTRIGRFMRQTSIDEIPQFLNVLKGEMSLVGPRPPIPEEVVRYEPWQLKRLSVRPGLTCLWQISGRSRIGFEEWMRLDLHYIRRQSLGMDLGILMRTIPAVLSRDGAY